MFLTIIYYFPSCVYLQCIPRFHFSGIIWIQDRVKQHDKVLWKKSRSGDISPSKTSQYQSIQIYTIVRIDISTIPYRSTTLNHLIYAKTVFGYTIFWFTTLHVLMNFFNLHPFSAIVLHAAEKNIIHTILKLGNLSLFGFHAYSRPEQ